MSMREDEMDQEKDVELQLFADDIEMDLWIKTFLSILEQLTEYRSEIQNNRAIAMADTALRAFKERRGRRTIPTATPQKSGTVRKV